MVSRVVYKPSSSISSSSSTSSPGCRPSKRITSRTSVGKLNDVLLLEDLLPAVPPVAEGVRPLLENEVLRDGGAESPSVAPALLGENDRVPSGLTVVPSRFKAGISGDREQIRIYKSCCRHRMRTYHPRLCPSQRCNAHMESLAL